MPIPFVITLFFWTNALGDAIALIGKNDLEKTKGGGSTKAVGFVEIVRIGKYVAFIIVVFLAVVIFGGNVVAFLNDAKVFGLVVVFALQPWLKNLVGGMTIFYDEKYVLADEVRFGGVQGVIADITLRSTRLVRSDKSIAVIPNGRLLEQPLANLSQRNANFVVVRTPLDYTAPVDHVRTLITHVEEALRKLHVDIYSHVIWDDSIVLENIGSGNGQRSSVTLEGDYELVVKTFTKTVAGTTAEVATQANKKLVSEIVLCISEKMKEINIQRRARLSGGGSTSNGTIALDPALRNLNDDDDNDYATTLMAFYI